MSHIFVETNWVVDCCAPAHNRVPAAVDLLRRARKGEVQLHLPSICIAEARFPLHQKFQTRITADQVRRYVTWALKENRLTNEQAGTVRVVLDGLQSVVQNELRAMEQTLRDLAAAPGLKLINYDSDRMHRACELAFTMPDLKPYDQAVLATVTTRGEQLYRAGEREMYFCELDSDLQPWDKDGKSLEKLAKLYDAANVWVCGDYLLQNHPAPENWHNRAR